MVSKISPRRFQDEPRAGRSQKIDMDELQALLDINCAQTENRLAERLGVTQQAISVRLHTMENVWKVSRWVSHELSEDNKNRRRDTALTFLSMFRKKDFLHKIITGDEKWILYDNVENHGLILINLRHRRQSPISTPRKICFVSGGIGKVCCITNCYNRVKPRSRQTAINNN